jgi:hypothetical protein
MDTYFIRIYRRDRAEEMVGVVQHVGRHWQSTFHNREELIAILAEGGPSDDARAEPEPPSWESR